MTHQYKVGDKVRALVDRLDITKGNIYTVTRFSKVSVFFNDDVGEENGMLAVSVEPVTDTPKAWKDMTDAEKGALLLAKHEGKTIQVFILGRGWVERTNLIWYDIAAYRIKPAEPVVHVVDRWCYYGDGGEDQALVRWMFTDGKPTKVELVE